MTQPWPTTRNSDPSVSARPIDRGSIAPVLALLLAAALISSVVVVSFATAALERARAQTAADAAALASVVEGRAAAVEFARLNGAELVTFTRSGQTVHVQVKRDSTVAEAAAIRV